MKRYVMTSIYRKHLENLSKQCYTVQVKGKIDYKEAL